MADPRCRHWNRQLVDQIRVRVGATWSDRRQRWLADGLAKAGIGLASRAAGASSVDVIVGAAEIAGSNGAASAAEDILGNPKVVRRLLGIPEPVPVPSWQL